MIKMIVRKGLTTFPGIDINRMLELFEFLEKNINVGEKKIDARIGHILIVIGNNKFLARSQNWETKKSFLYTKQPKFSTNWGHIFTARIRRMGEGTVFSLFVSSHLGGVPQSGLGGGVPHPKSGQGLYPIPGLAGGYPIPGLGEGVPHRVPPRPGTGYPPRPGMGYPLDLGWGTPQTWHGVPPRPGMGYPPQTWDGVPPGPGMGYPPDLGWVPPQTWDGVPPQDLRWGTPPDLGWGSPPPTWDIASFCYAAGGMPLAFTQEDFLVASICAILRALSVFGDLSYSRTVVLNHSTTSHLSFAATYASSVQISSNAFVVVHIQCNKSLKTKPSFEQSSKNSRLRTESCILRSVH